MAPTNHADTLSFGQLETLRRFLVEIGQRQVQSLKFYQAPKSKGFYHKYTPADELAGNEERTSKASTATCILALAGTHQLEQFLDEPAAENLLRTLLNSEWSSAKLPNNNPFTVAFILESVTVLHDYLGNPDLPPADDLKIASAEKILVDALRDGNGSARILTYPSSAYLTQLSARVLKRRNRLDLDLVDKINRWAWEEIKLQLSLMMSNSKVADIYGLAYSIILVASLVPSSETTPEEKLLRKTGLQQVFGQQLPDGSWPRSRPLFHYPDVGSAYCFEYEMLVQMLQEPALEAELLNYLPNLSRAAYALKDSAFDLTDGGVAWASGHHPQLRGPESWSTASVFHFVHALGRLVSEAIRREIFAYLDAPYLPPRDAKTSDKEFATDLLDSAIFVDEKRASLRDELWHRFVNPIAREANKIRDGGSFSRDTPISAILFGPPGTSKTELTKKISDFLGWPRVVIDPSHLVRNGLDQVQAEANKLFGMLATAERIVVLFDEFDEMVRDRASANSETLSRFLTTAMLPKLSSIYQRRRIVFILATNYIDHFDFAISRRGRFDHVIQVMPPTAEQKLAHWLQVKTNMDKLNIKLENELHAMLESLTYGEFESIVPRLASASRSQEFLEIVNHAFSNCTLERAATEPQADLSASAMKWSERCKGQRMYVRFAETVELGT